jgi:hypothetical protein
MGGLSGVKEYGGDARTGTETAMPYLHMSDAHLVAAA